MRSRGSWGSCQGESGSCLQLTAGAVIYIYIHLVKLICLFVYLLIFMYLFWRSVRNGILIVSLTSHFPYFAWHNLKESNFLVKKDNNIKWESLFLVCGRIRHNSSWIIVRTWQWDPNSKPAILLKLISLTNEWFFFTVEKN